MFGPYDCYSNAVSYLLLMKSIDLHGVYAYNFNMGCDPVKRNIFGSVTSSTLLEFMRDHGIKTEHSLLNEMKNNEPYIVDIDLFYVPSSEYFQRHHIGHCMIITELEDDLFYGYDPYFNKETIFERKLLFDAWIARGERPLLKLNTDDHVLSNTLQITPYLTQVDYPKLYAEVSRNSDEVFDWFIEHYLDDIVFNKIFGMIRSISVARERHFQVINSSMKNQILSAWRQLEVSLVRMHTAKVVLKRSHFMTQLEKALEYEQTYLDSVVLSTRSSIL